MNKGNKTKEQGKKGKAGAPQQDPDPPQFVALSGSDQVVPHVPLKLSVKLPKPGAGTNLPE